MIYLVISGASVPALCAFIMGAVAFGAVLVDRPAISMRGLAASLAIIVVVMPDSVVEPGFQMSFAATAALVALFEERIGCHRVIGDPGMLIKTVQGLWASVAEILSISLIAGIATDPFALYHFQRVTVSGLIANLAVSPIMSFVVAPAALAAGVLAPFGAAAPAVSIMADSLALVAGVGHMFASRPEAVLSAPAMGAGPFMALVVGLLWMCIWRGAVRWAGLVAGAA